MPKYMSNSTIFEKFFFFFIKKGPDLLKFTLVKKTTEDTLKN